jgi:rfaE bifunctional protein kinase chain/domain
MAHNVSCERAQELIAAFSKQRILVIGDVVLDHYVEGVVERLNPETSVPLLDVRSERLESGGAGNVAKNVASLGAQATLISVVGTDTAADQVRLVATKEGYTAELIPDSSRPTPHKARFLANSQHLLRVDDEKRHNIASEIEGALLEKITAAVTAGIQGIIVSDYAKGVITERVVQTLVKLARDKKIILGVDAKPSRLPYVTGATFIAPNLKEAREFLGVTHESIEAKELARQLHAKLNTTVCLTLSADGIMVYDTESPGVHVPQAHRPEVFDVSGAGDAATVVLLLSRLSGASWLEAAELANAAGAIVVSKTGAVGVSSEELNNMMCHKHG